MTTPIRFSPDTVQFLAQAALAEVRQREAIARWRAEHPQAREVAPGVWADPSGECLEV